MTEFDNDKDAAKHWISMNIIEDGQRSTRKFTLQLKPGDIHVGNRGAESVGGIGEELAQLRNEAGLNSGQVAISRGDNLVTVETTMDNWNKLREHVKPVDKASELGFGSR